MKNKKVIYELTIEDIQTVANQEIQRDLSSDEIEKIINSIVVKINWYDAIAHSISEKIDLVSAS